MENKTTYMIKILSVGFLFILFGIICLIGNLCFLPIVLLNLQKQLFFRNFSRDLVRLSWFAFLSIVKLFHIFDISFQKKDNLGENGELIVANHPSLLDIVILISNIKRCNCVVKDELRKNIFLCLPIKACDYIPNTKNEKLLENSIKALKNGESLIIFPEGTRTKEHIVFHKAASYIAIKSAKKVTPIIIQMKPRIFQKNQKWYEIPNNLIKYKLLQMPSIKTDDFLLQRPIPIRARRLHDELMNIYKGVS